MKAQVTLRMEVKELWPGLAFDGHQVKVGDIITVTNQVECKSLEELDGQLRKDMPSSRRFKNIQVVEIKEVKEN